MLHGVDKMQMLLDCSSTAAYYTHSVRITTLLFYLHRKDIYTVSLSTNSPPCYQSSPCDVKSHSFMTRLNSNLVPVLLCPIPGPPPPAGITDPVHHDIKL